MSKLDDCCAKYAEQMKDKLGMRVDKNLLRAVAKACGPSLYKRDASTVACSQKSELETVKKNFAMKKLGVSEKVAEKAVADACKKYGKIRTKHRAVFYYMIVKSTKKTAMFA